MFVLPIEVVSQWFDIIDLDAKFIAMFEEKTGRLFPINLKTLKEYKRKETQGIEVNMTPCREAKLKRVQQFINIDLTDSEILFKSERYLSAYKLFLKGMNNVFGQCDSQNTFSVINEGTKLIDEMINFTRSFSAAQPNSRKEVFLKNTLMPRFLPSHIYSNAINYLSDIPIDDWATDQVIQEILLMTNIGVMLYLIACLDLEDLIRTGMPKPISYFVPFIPREPFEKFNPTSTKIDMWADFAGSIRKSCNGDDLLRITVQKWKADVERPNQTKFTQWMTNIAKLKYPDFHEDQILASIDNAWIHWKIALFLTNMKNCFIGKRRNTKYAVFTLSNRADLASCFKRYDTYLDELKMQVGL